MKAFLAEIIPKLQKFTKKLDELSLLLNHHWVLLDQPSALKSIYIFRQNSELLISVNGKVEKSKWDYLGNKSLLIESTAGSFLFKIGFFDENVLALKLDNTDGYIFLVNETRASKELNTIESIIDFLSGTYLTESDIKKDDLNSSMENRELPPKESESRLALVFLTLFALLAVTIVLAYKNFNKSAEIIEPNGSVNILNTPTINLNPSAITLGRDTVYLNEPWEITVTAENQLKSYDNFPEIEGLRKRGTSTGSSTSIINGQINSSQSVTMTYVAIKIGDLTIHPFEMKINGKVFFSQGKSIFVISK